MGKTLSKMQLKLEKHLDSILVCSHWEHYSTTRHGLAWDGKAFLSGLLGNREASGGGGMSLHPQPGKEAYLFPQFPPWDAKEALRLLIHFVLLNYPPEAIPLWREATQVNYTCLMRQVPIVSRSWPRSSRGRETNHIFLFCWHLLNVLRTTSSVLLLSWW